MAYEVYDAKFQQDAVRASQKYALGLPSGPKDYQIRVQNSVQSHRVGTPATPANLVQLVQGPYYHRRVSGLLECDWGAAHPNGGVERVRLYKVTHEHGTNDLNPLTGTRFVAPGEAQAMYALFLEFVKTPDGFEAYFLPWEGTGGVVYMTLPQGPGGPRLFFTAALSGCSVIVAGPPQQPTIYHCGVDDWGPNTPYVNPPYAQANDPPVPDRRTTHEIWVDLVSQLRNDPDATFRSSTIDKRHYVDDFEGGALTTADSREFELRLQHQQRDDHASVIPFGCVFGVKDAATNNWSFYLQSNASLNYKHRRRARPIKVTQFYPNWQNFARLWN